MKKSISVLYKYLPSTNNGKDVSFSTIEKDLGIEIAVYYEGKEGVTLYQLTGTQCKKIRLYIARQKEEEERTKNNSKACYKMV